MGTRAIGAALFLLSAAAGTAFGQETGSGMVGYWKLDEAAAPSKDSSGNVNDGAWSATGAASVTGASYSPKATPFSTGCLDFSDATAQVSVPGTAALTLTGDFTVAFWMFPHSEINGNPFYDARADVGDWQRMVGKGNTTQRTFGVWRFPGNSHRIKFQMYDQTGGSVLDLDSNGTTPNAAWTHIVCRIQGNAAAIFINGVQDITANRSAAPGFINTDPLTLAYAGFHTSFPGRLDDVRLYNRALTPAEISGLAAGGTGPSAPTSLVADPGDNQVSLSWSGSATYYNVKRSNVQGGSPAGTYTTIATLVSTPSYLDTTATSGTTWYYVVSGVTYGEGPVSSEVSCLPLPVTALPNSGLSTNENGAPATFTIKYNTAPAADSVLTVSSSNTGEGVVSTGYTGVAGSYAPTATGFTVTVPAGTTPSITVTVTGVNDLTVDPAHAYSVTVTAGGFAYTIPPVQLINNDNDFAGITVSRLSGLVTTESGGIATFTVSLNTQPSASVNMNVTVSNSAEVSVSPTLVTFDNTNWNTAIQITVTGVDDQALDFTQPFSVLMGPLSGASEYSGMTVPSVTGVNLDNETIPPAQGAWGGGGCGLLGLEIALPLLLAALARRRRF